MGLTAGFKLGPYEILSPLGVGGMGEVYRARDTKLRRDVAIKVLPEAFANNPERMARFQREAQVLASLNHPNIAAIYGLEESGATRALVMELVEGPTLAERLRSGPVSPDDALPIARQVAEALEYAHERNIVHRDLKPANVKITPEGMVKVLDFGLAKALDPGVASPPAGTPPLQELPTLSAAETQAGVILGTPAYMPPEQAKGKPVDRRADIWAFGCVLFEMLTGKLVFKGETVTDAKDPEWEELPKTTPLVIQLLVRRCLTKDPKQRLRDIGEARIAIEETISGAGATHELILAVQTTPVQSSLRRWLPWGLGVVCALLAATLVVGHFSGSSVVAHSTRSLISLPESVSFAFEGPFGGPVLSPDGTKLVFPARDDTGQESLWVRPMDSTAAKRLEGTEGASFPFWSPDSRRLSFFQNEELKKMDAAGGPVVKLCNAKNPRGGTWSRDDVIVFAPNAPPGSLFRVAAAGGTPAPVATRKPSGPGSVNRWPTFLPDGRHFLYLSGSLTAPGTPELGIYMGKLGTDEVTFIVQADSRVQYAAPGYLLFLRGGMLMAQPFDAGILKLKGEAYPLIQQVASPLAFRLGLFTVSQTGLLAFQIGGAAAKRQFVWFDALGKQMGALGEPGDQADLQLSPDGNRLAYVKSSSEAKNDDIWVMDLTRSVRTRVTLGTSISAAPIWSPDGTRIVYSYSSPQTGIRNLYVKNASGTGKEGVLLASDANKYPLDWSRDGRYILFMSADPKAKSAWWFDIWALPLFGDRKAFPYLHTRFDEAEAVFSPSGRWVAYGSNESGSHEIYFSPFPGASSKLQVSQGGGMQPRWNRDGSALYFLAPGERLMQVAIKEKGSTLEIGKPKELFQTEMGDAKPGERAYSVAPDGKRFLIIKPVEIAVPPLTLLTNWTVGLKE